MTNDLLALARYRNVIIDMDGTLMVSNEAHAHAFADAFEQHGVKNVGFNEVRKLMGMSGMGILCRVLDEATFDAKGAEIDQDRLRIFEERYLPSVAPAPGVLPLLELLKSHGVRVALSSASPKRIVDAFIERLGMGGLIEGTVSGEEVPESKPHPAAIEAVCEKFGFKPEETLLVGDSPYDVIAAHEFNMPTLGVLTGGYTEEELRKTGASEVYADLGGLYKALQETILKPSS